ncbi:hypothetical protein C8R46DRAFT_1309389 [Mycena filopes]|nr:hypothetical protein C8R46DRAFT_1309389 [Mycena filopes]
MAEKAAQLFQGVAYLVPGGDVLVRQVLDGHGAVAASGPRAATRIIADSTTFPMIKGVESNAVIVEPDWVYCSLQAGVKLPTAPYEFNEQVAATPTRATASAARRFCEELLSSTKISRPAGPSAPLPSLPFEILAKIFIAFRDVVLDDHSTAMADLLPILQVCRRWRGVAHYTQPLWTHMVLNFHSKRQYQRLLRLMEESAAATPRSHNPIMSFLVAHGPRIRELSLTLPTAHFRHFLTIPTGSFPALEKLDLLCIPLEERDESGVLWRDVAAPFTVFNGLPRLREFTMFTTGCQTLDCTKLPLSWSSLTHIDLIRVGLGVFDTAWVLPMFTQVQKLRLCTTDTQGFFMPPIAPVRLPLVELDWVALGVIDAVSVLGPLILPRLTSLELREGCGASFLKLYDHSKFALHSLCLVFHHISLPSFSAFLRGMPSLTSLELRMCLSISNELLDFLTYNNAREGVLPQLERLVLCDRAQIFEESKMLRMVESRWRATPLTQIRISTTQKVSLGPRTITAHRAVLNRVIELMEEGLVFSYECK